MMKNTDRQTVAAHAARTPRSVLVADDSIALRKFLLAALYADDLKVVEAVDGLDAYLKAQEEHFDLLVTDQNMPKMCGVELVRKLRALPSYQAVPMLMLTVDANDELRQRAKAAGATGWIVKSLDPEHIVAVIHRLLAEPESPV